MPAALRRTEAGNQRRREDSVAKAQLSKLYFARLDGSNHATALAGGVCYCCKTAVATGYDGSIYAAWRHVYPGNVRDIAVTLSLDSGRSFETPIRVSDDRWVLDGCPENGPALAVDSHNAVHVLWPPTLVSGPAAGDEPELAIAWDEQLNGTRRVVAADAAANGRPGFIRVPSLIPSAVSTRSSPASMMGLPRRGLVARLLKRSFACSGSRRRLGNSRLRAQLTEFPQRV